MLYTAALPYFLALDKISVYGLFNKCPAYLNKLLLFRQFSSMVLDVHLLYTRLEDPAKLNMPHDSLTNFRQHQRIQRNCDLLPSKDVVIVNISTTIDY